MLTANATEQTQEQKDLAAHCRSKVEEIRSSASRASAESIWMNNIAYLLGYDGVNFNSRTRSFEPINKASAYVKKNRLHVNKILPTIQNRLARLCKNPPKYEAKPESNSTEDKDAARLGLQILESMWEKLSLNEKRLSLYMWLQQCGHAYIKICWDPTLGQLMPNPEFDPNDPNAYEYENEGDVRGEVVNSFEVFPDPQAKSFEEVLQTYLYQCKVRKLDYFRAQYPEFGHLVKEEPAWLLSNQYEQRVNNMNARGGAQNNESKDSAVEVIKYEAPTRKYPRGRMIVSANGILLEEKDLPCGEIPFAKFDDIIIGGKYNSESIITHLRPIQDQFNETIRRRAEWTKKLLAGKYKAARGMALAQESLNDESGEVVYFNVVPNAPNGPEPIQVPNIPQWAYVEEDRLSNIFNNLAGLSDVAQGQLPSASIPAKGMEILQEADDTRIGIMTEQHEHAWARVGSLILKYVEKYYVMPRKIKIAGRRFQYSVQEVSGSMLKGNTDVFVRRGSTIPGSKVLQRQDILNAYQFGLLGDPNDTKVKENVLGMIEFGTTEEMWEDYGLDMAQIKRGIEQLEQGMPVEVSEFDNHAIWVQELNRYRKSEKWSTLPPQLQFHFLGCIEGHIQALMKMTNASPEIPPPNPPAPPELDPETEPLEQVDPQTGTPQPAA